MDQDKFDLILDRPDCIGCGACVAVAPDYWDMADDGQAIILKAKKNPDGTMNSEITKKEFDVNYEAAQSCPVNVIHLRKKGDDKNII